MTKDRKYKFNFILIDQDIKIVDQNVNSFTFINKGTKNVSINNQLLLRGSNAGSNQFDTFSETLAIGEKTAQSYSIVFATGGNDTALLQVIQKIEVFD